MGMKRKLVEENGETWIDPEVLFQKRQERLERRRKRRERRLGIHVENEKEIETEQEMEQEDVGGEHEHVKRVSPPVKRRILN